jgi:hypothetical protein
MMEVEYWYRNLPGPRALRGRARADGDLMAVFVQGTRFLALGLARCIIISCTSYTSRNNKCKGQDKQQ